MEKTLLWNLMTKAPLVSLAGEKTVSILLQEVEQPVQIFILLMMFPAIGVTGLSLSVKLRKDVILSLFHLHEDASKAG